MPNREQERREREVQYLMDANGVAKSTVWIRRIVERAYDAGHSAGYAQGVRDALKVASNSGVEPGTWGQEAVREEIITAVRSLIPADGETS